MITDVVMPRLSGHQVAERARCLRPQLKVPFSSGYTSDVITQQQLLEDGVAFLQKPYVLEELARRVRDVLDAPPPGAR